MAAEVEQRIDSDQVQRRGQSGEARMLVMAALLMADELYELRQKLQAAQSGRAGGTAADRRSEAGAGGWRAGKTRRGDCRGPGASLSCDGRSCPVRQAIHPRGQ